MSRHPFDPIALVLGAAVCLAGALAVADADIGSLPGWLMPVAIIAVGTVMVLGALLRTNRPPATVPAGSAGSAGSAVPTVPDESPEEI